MTAPSRILVVDDVEAHRYVMASWLRREGFEVVEAGTGAEAIAKARQDVDVLVLDVHLPDMTGYDVCAAVKSDPATAALPVMHVSATAIDGDSRARGLNGGAQAYLVEPLDVAEFLATVRALARTARSKQRSDRSVEQLTRLAEVTAQVNAAQNLVDLLTALVTGAAQMLGGPALAEGTFGDGRTARAVCAGPGAAARSESSTTAGGAGWPKGVLVTGNPPQAWAEILAATQVVAPRWCVIPVGEQALRAVIAVAVPAGESALPEFELGLLGQLATTAGVALDNLRAFTTEHLIALTLQRALLPRALPLVPGLELEARYFAAEEGVSVGGDFYDAFELAGGRTCVAVGDVQGHSLHAATLMAELRFSLRAFLTGSPSAARALNLLDELMRRNHPREMATLALLVFEDGCRRVEVANAGHIPPLLVTAGDARFIEHASPILGIVPKDHDSHWVELTEPCVLALVTDGLIERRGEDLAASMQRMRDTVVAAATLDPITLADVLVGRFATGPAQDDIALLLARAHPS
ncbi:MAG TPA: fused response regulator/phosphatase [Sporichthyaceae bacterium]|nr:fused response regulator/phosphatase [Sporichthyaceae bacterium]